MVSEIVWSYDKLMDVYNNMDNKLLASRYIHINKWSQVKGARIDSPNIHPTLTLLLKNGEHFMSFWPEKGREEDGHVYCYLDLNRFSNKTERDKLIERLNKLSIFDYEIQNFYPSGENSKESLDKLSEAEFDGFMSILEDYC